MNSFEAIGQARLLAAEGQRQFAVAMARGFRRLLARLVDGICRHLPSNKAHPW